MNEPKQRNRIIVTLRVRLPSVLLACGMMAVLAACTSSSVNTLVDNMPSAIGLPADAPDRPAVPPAYPPVHDMPPPRADAKLTAEEQEKLEHELVAVRTRQEVVTGVGSATAKNAARNAAKPRPTTADTAPRVIPATSSRATIY